MLIIFLKASQSLDKKLEELALQNKLHKTNSTKQWLRGHMVCTEKNTQLLKMDFMESFVPAWCPSLRYDDGDDDHLMMSKW